VKIKKTDIIKVWMALQMQQVVSHTFTIYFTYLPQFIGLSHQSSFLTINLLYFQGKYIYNNKKPKSLIDPLFKYLINNNNQYEVKKLLDFDEPFGVTFAILPLSTPKLFSKSSIRILQLRTICSKARFSIYIYWSYLHEHTNTWKWYSIGLYLADWRLSPFLACF